ncbi:hypothetical protein [Thermoactinomyces mirandus]|uniref:Uncharacterized protein n=1 Tax=Thermoactinomyces mirandus TaxID=2756294 RepID=A0A7W1XPN9_9BACL|nr:hypothetical protein [Thermoactinomyces mirandus]MBA4600984.1 hypothetical protein [Thermoactinomyces mirandus]
MKRLLHPAFAFMLVMAAFFVHPAFAATKLAGKDLYPADQYADTVVTVSATVAEIRGYDSDYEHQHILVDDIDVLEIDNGHASIIPNRAFVSIRMDERGIEGPIPGLRPGEPIVIRGEFIPEDEAYKTPYNCCDAVIHFTHDPVGYVRYDGVTYR